MLQAHGSASIVLPCSANRRLSLPDPDGEQIRAMKTTVSDSHRPRLEAAVVALRQNDFARAADLLRALAAELPAAAMPWEMLARAEEARGDRAAAAAALDSRLLLDKRDIGALLLKARLFEQARQPRQNGLPILPRRGRASPAASRRRAARLPARATGPRHARSRFSAVPPPRPRTGADNFREPRSSSRGIARHRSRPAIACGSRR